MFPQRVQHLLFLFPDSGQNCSAGSKGERLSAQLRALPGTDEPYESSSNKEPGECLWVCWDGRGADASIWGSVGVSETQTKLVVTWEAFLLTSGCSLLTMSLTGSTFAVFPFPLMSPSALKPRCLLCGSTWPSNRKTQNCSQKENGRG